MSKSVEPIEGMEESPEFDSMMKEFASGDVALESSSGSIAVESASGSVAVESASGSAA